MPAPDWLDLPFTEQLDYFRSKLPLPTEQWNELSDIEQDIAFTLAQVTKADLLVDAKKLVERAIASGMSLDEFKAQFAELMQRQGWTKEFNDSRIRTIYDTNLRRSYAAGRYAQMKEPELLETRPYWMWRHRTPDPNFGGQPRPEHKALNNKVFPADHSFWKVAFPACAWGCRCTAFAVSEGYIRRKGLKIGNPPNPKNIADPGFRVAPGSVPEQEREQIIEQKLASLPQKLAQKLRKAL